MNVGASVSSATPVCVVRRIGWGYRVLAVIAFVYLGLLVVAPLFAVFAEAFRAGWFAYVRSLVDRDTRHAIGLTLLVASIVVPLNSMFGLAAAWALAKFDFRGKNFWITLIDIPFSVSPVVAGVFYLMLYGAHGLLGPWLQSHGITIAFSVTGIILVNLFVTLPFVVRELLPLMQSQGTEEEEAALSLGASGWQLFWKITLPNIKWALFYGVILCNARSMGEFGAVTVIAGAIRGETTTLPLHAEILFNEYNAAGAFAVASLLTLLALVTMVARHCVERCEEREIQAAVPPSEMPRQGRRSR